MLLRRGLLVLKGDERGLGFGGWWDFNGEEAGLGM